MISPILAYDQPIQKCFYNINISTESVCVPRTQTRVVLLTACKSRGRNVVILQRITIYWPDRNPVTQRDNMCAM